MVLQSDNKFPVLYYDDIINTSVALEFIVTKLIILRDYDKVNRFVKRRMSRRQRR